MLVLIIKRLLPTLPGKEAKMIDIHGRTDSLEVTPLKSQLQECAGPKDHSAPPGSGVAFPSSSGEVLPAIAAGVVLEAW
jgi:hypothetical protein